MLGGDHFSAGRLRGTPESVTETARVVEVEIPLDAPAEEQDNLFSEIKQPKKRLIKRGSSAK